MKQRCPELTEASGGKKWGDWKERGALRMESGVEERRASFKMEGAMTWEGGGGMRGGGWTQRSCGPGVEVLGGV